MSETIKQHSPEEIFAAVGRARKAQPGWETFGFKKRASLIIQTRDLILDQLDEMAALISEENGKPVIEAISHDIMPVLDLMSYFSKRAEGILKKEKICLGKWQFLGHQSHIEYEALGVVGIISPWNFPFSIPAGGAVVNPCFPGIGRKRSVDCSSGCGCRHG